MEICILHNQQLFFGRDDEADDRACKTPRFDGEQWDESGTEVRIQARATLWLTGLQLTLREEQPELLGSRNSNRSDYSGG